MGKILKTKALDYIDGKFVCTEIEIPIETREDTGTNLTYSAFDKMVKEDKIMPLKTDLDLLLIDPTKNIREINEILDTNIGILFGKQILLSILMQDNCEGIKFYFCKNQFGKNSLAIIGFDKDKNDIGSKPGKSSIFTKEGETPPPPPNTAEVGDTKKLKDILKDMNDNGFQDIKSVIGTDNIMKLNNNNFL